MKRRIIEKTTYGKGSFVKAMLLVFVLMVIDLPLAVSWDNIINQPNFQMLSTEYLFLKILSIISLFITIFIFNEIAKLIVKMKNGE